MPHRMVVYGLRLGNGCHSRQSGNLLKDWIPGQARNDKLRRIHIITYSSIVFFLPIIFLSAFSTTVFSQPSPVLEVGMFSMEKGGEAIPTEWKPLDIQKY